MFTRVLRSPDAEGGAALPADKATTTGEGPSTPSTGSGQAGSGQAAGATVAPPAELPLGGENGMRPDLRVQHKAWLLGGTLSDRGVREMLADCCNFLRQLVLITSNVVESIGIGQVRKIVGSEIPIPSGVILEDGTIAMQMVAPEPAEATSGAPDRDHRKNPRGRKHPLTVLIQLAVQAAKLLFQIGAGLNPKALNKEPLVDRQARRAERRSPEAYEGAYGR